MSFAIRLIFILVVLIPSHEVFSGDHDGTDHGNPPESVLIIRDARMKMLFLRVYRNKFSLQEIDEKSGEELGRVEGTRGDRISFILRGIVRQDGFSKGVWVKEIVTDPNEFEDSCLVALAIAARGGYVIRYLKDGRKRRALFSNVHDLLNTVLNGFSPVCVGLQYECAPQEMNPRRGEVFEEGRCPAQKIHPPGSGERSGDRTEDDGG